MTGVGHHRAAVNRLIVGQVVRVENRVRSLVVEQVVDKLGILLLKVSEMLRLPVKILLADNSEAAQPNDEQADCPAGDNSTNKMRPGAVFG